MEGRLSKYKMVLGLMIVVLFALFSFHSSDAQSRYKSKNRSMNKWRYSKGIIKPEKVCSSIRKNKKRVYKSKKQYTASHKVTFAEGGAPKFNPYANDPKSSARTVHVTPKPDISHMTIDEKHDVEDQVLVKNKLPEPSSAKHDQIRKDVEKHLVNFEEEKPLTLAPLYFVVDQDEFAFVDMDPFLIAVEYALHGKHLLIEGHTDKDGNSNYNVQLSIKRVERIRELMVQMGVDDNHISIVGYGEEHSDLNEASTAAVDDKQLDRRVDFTVF